MESTQRKVYVFKSVLLNFSDKVSILSDNGAKTVLVPMDNLAELSTLPTTVLGKTDVPFYANTQMIIQKMML